MGNKISAKPTKVSDALGKKIAGTTANMVKKNTLCKTCK
jgi:hypothetical protein|tara:strand:+ start:572 stop:688 length:117 start_codon:yes stop_codon:yes gene_type:complete